MAMFTFSVLDQKYPFWVKFGPKIKISSLRAEIWYLEYFEYVKFDDDVNFFCFRPFF